MTKPCTEFTTSITAIACIYGYDGFWGFLPVSVVPRSVYVGKQLLPESERLQPLPKMMEFHGES